MDLITSHLCGGDNYRVSPLSGRCTCLVGSSETIVALSIPIWGMKVAECPRGVKVQTAGNRR